MRASTFLFPRPWSKQLFPSSSSHRPRCWFLDSQQLYRVGCVFLSILYSPLFAQPEQHYSRLKFGSQLFIEFSNRIFFIDIAMKLGVDQKARGGESLEASKCLPPPPTGRFEILRLVYGLQLRTDHVLLQWPLWCGQSVSLIWSVFCRSANQRSAEKVPDMFSTAHFLLMMTAEPLEKARENNLLLFEASVVWTLPRSVQITFYDAKSEIISLGFPFPKALRSVVNIFIALQSFRSKAHKINKRNYPQGWW